MAVHSTEVRVRYADTDQGGVVYNANYLVFFEVGRTELMRELGCTYADLERDGFVMPVIETGIRFRAPAVYDDLLVVESELTEVERVRIRIDSRVIRARDGRLLAEGFVRLACTDGRGRPIAMPEETRRALMQDKG